MSPAEFPESNIVVAKDQPQFIPIPCLHDAKSGVLVMCWELTDDEIAKLTVTKRLWHSVITQNKPLQPIMLSVTKSDLINVEGMPS